MEQRIIYTIFLFYFCGSLGPNLSRAQNNSLSISLNYPIPVGDTFYSGFHGIGGLDIKYAQPLHDHLFLSGNLGYLRSRSTQNDRINLNKFNAGLGLSRPIKISSIIELQPQLELEYALLRFHNETIEEENQNSDFQNLDGVDLNGWQFSFLLSMNHKITDKFSFGLTVGYEFIYIPREGFSRPYNQEMHSICLGLKTILIFKK